MAAQDEDEELKELFSPLADKLMEAEVEIVSELNAAQGSAVDIGGYYHPDPKLTSAAMRPSKALNTILASIG